MEITERGAFKCLAGRWLPVRENIGCHRGNPLPGALLSRVKAFDSQVPVCSCKSELMDGHDT